MYNSFFGFKERPFKLVPNPEYVYLSRVHEEVLAHLNYAVKYGEGFVEITGEVGTGKTTLCRMFLENLDEDTEVAYIFNPKLDSLQLLKAINDEFYLPSDTDSEKILIDDLNAFLLKKKAQGRRVILLVDEAQNLGADVLEQLRLLSNLETNTSKLLQIILVGQPELGALLATDRLRQLNQRITLSCHLIPLTEEETREYIRHRLHIASSRPGVSFSSSACRSIFNYSGGVPRLINIACDRALLIAFTSGKQRIGKTIVKRAIRELAGKHKRHRPALKWPQAAMGGIAVAVVLGAAILGAQALLKGRGTSVEAVVHHRVAKIEKEDPEQSAPPSLPPDVQTPVLEKSLDQPSSPAPVDDVPQIPIADKAPQTVALPEPSIVDLQQTIATMTDSLRSRNGALGAAFNVWEAPFPDLSGPLNELDSDIFFRVAARRSELEILKVKGNLNVIRKLNLPAILEFLSNGENNPQFLAVLELSGDEIRLSDGDSDFFVPAVSLAGLWSGVAWIVWKDFYHLQGVIPVSSPGEVVLSLKLYLKSLGFPVAQMNTDYDGTARAAVETIQARHGLDADGMVGPLTKIVLYNEDRSLDIPHLIPVP